MKYNYLNIYNNLIKLTRNKKLYLNLEKDDSFSERLVFLFLHLAFFIRHYKNSAPSKNLQELFDFIIRQIELSIREIGYGDVSVNKKMKDYINLFHDIIDKFHFWDDLSKERKQEIIANYTSNSKNSSFLLDYFESFLISLKKNTLNSYIKSVIKN